MKKLSLKKWNLNTDDLLQREQLKTVFGGGYDGCGDGEPACSSGSFHCCCDSTYKGCKSSTQDCLNAC